MDIVILNASTAIGVRTIGAHRTANELRKNGFSVKVIDFAEYLTEHGIADLIVMLEKYVTLDTLWVGVSSTWFWRLRDIQSGKIKARYNIPNSISPMLDVDDDEAETLRTLIRSISPNCKIVCGGARANALSYKNFYDVYILGYSEIHAVDFSLWLIGKNPFFQYKTVDEKMVIDYNIKATAFDFSTSSTDWTQEHLQPGEALPIEISRGCIFSCKFCSFLLNGKKKNDYTRNTDVLYAEIMRNYDLAGTTNYILCDDTHNDSAEKLEILYDEVWAKLPFKVSFSCYLRLDLLAAKPHTIDLLLASGLHSAFFGIESLNTETNKIIGKGISQEKIIATLELCRSKWGDRVSSRAGFIVGLPKDTEESCSNWLELLYDPTFPLDSKIIYPLYIGDPQSKIWLSAFEREPEKYGYVLTEHGNNYFTWENTFTGMTHTKATEMAANAQTRLGFQPPAGFENTAIAGMGFEYDKNVDWKNELAIRYRARRETYWAALRNE